jgi:hypothetical protein
MTTGNRTKILISIGAAVGLVAVIVILIGSNSTRTPAPRTASAISTPTPSALAEASPGGTPAVLGSIQPFNDAAKDLLTATDAQASRKILAKLRAYLLTLPKSVAVRLIDQFLNGKRDALTKLQFTIEKNGLLSSAPTLRVFLLDLLAQVDPQAASQYAMQILSTPGSPDEWAISLRNYALGGSPAATHAFMESKLAEMLANGAWRNDPSVGFLEAFDTAVYTHDTALTPTLSQLMADKDNRAVAHAAYLTLDRLVLSDPATVLGQLESQPDLMQGHELTRADYFARADPGDPQQKAVLESYLLDPNRTQQELNAFAGVYPNENYMISNNLLTQTQTPTYTDIISRDRTALSVVQGWMSDPRFQTVQPQLQTMANRLQMFVNQAAAQR